MYETIEEFKNVSKGDSVFFKPDNKHYKVDGIEGDVLYLNDPLDGSSFTATLDELAL